MKNLFRILKILTCFIWLPLVFIFIFFALLSGEGGDLPELPDLSISPDMDTDLHTTPPERHAEVIRDVTQSAGDAAAAFTNHKNQQPAQKKTKTKITRQKLKTSLKASAKASVKKILN